MDEGQTVCPSVGGHGLAFVHKLCLFQILLHIFTMPTAQSKGKAPHKLLINFYLPLSTFCCFTDSEDYQKLTSLH